MDIDEKRINEFAYQIWQSEGEPEGQEERHWEMARKLAEAESSSPPVHVQERSLDESSTPGESSSDPGSIGS
jgi:hypothetical protein